ncbi:MAG TPA: FecR family protein [Puia sp.]|nr:FecR family protein [Puia sp.]
MEKELLDRYFEGRASEEEEKRVAAWLTDPGNEASVLDYIEAAYALETGHVPVTHFEDLLKRTVSQGKHPASLIPLQTRRLAWLVAAACALLLLSGVGLGYFLRARSVSNKVLSLNTAATAAGEYARLTLGDGSEVYLGSDSKLFFSQKMDAHPVIYLEGEAYFDLSGESRTITVKTRNLATTAKGSKFNIRALSKDSTVTVTVEKGKVELSNSGKTFPLLKLRFPGKDSVAANKSGNGDEPRIIPWVKLTPALTVKENEQATYDKNTNTAGISEMKPGTMPLMKLLPPRALRERADSAKVNDPDAFKTDTSETISQ